MNNLVKYRGKPVSSEMLSKEQRDAVGHFFVRLKAIDPGEYDRLMPDPKTEVFVKREYASSIVGLTRRQMDDGFAAYHQMRREGDPDYRFLNIDRVLGLMYQADSSQAAHKYIDGLEKDDEGEYYRVKLPEPQHIKEARKKKGREHCARLMDMLG